MWAKWDNATQTGWINRKGNPLKPWPVKEQGVAEGVTPASTSKVLRLIQRHHPEWFDNYGMGEVEDTVVDMAEMGQFSGMSAADALELVGQELESLYGQQGVAEGQTEGEATLAKIAAAGDEGFDMIYDGINGLLGTEAQIMLQDMYDDVSREYRLHPDDDFEQIQSHMMDRIQDDYGQQGVAEGPEREMDLDWHYKNIMQTKGLSDKAKQQTTDIYNKPQRTGLEFGHSVRWDNGLSMNISVTASKNVYVDYIIDSIVDGTSTGAKFIDFSHNEIAGIPSMFGTVQIKYAPE